MSGRRSRTVDVEPGARGRPSQGLSVPSMLRLSPAMHQAVAADAARLGVSAAEWWRRVGERELEHVARTTP